MSEVKVNKISPRTNCGTVQLGDSGDTITIPAGATITNNGTQTGFGREGSVDWQTTIKTSDFTAVSGEGYFIDTTSGEITMTLPSSPSAGAIVAIKDYANTFDTNKLIINRNGSNISGDATNPEIVTEGQALTLVYGDATKGWQSVAASTESDLPKAAFITATGGTITTVCTNFKVHTFTGPGTFTVTCAGNAAGSNTVSYLVVAGGGGGGSSSNGNGNAKGGGGAGGFREGRTPTCSYTVSPLNAPAGLPVSAQAYPITVGAGAAAQAQAPSPARGNAGNASSFSTISSAGGGTGAGEGGGIPGGQGGSGGSGGGPSSGPSTPGGSGNTPPVSPPQGQNGENNTRGCSTAGGGGGGAGQVGGTRGAAGGGNGVSTTITGSSTAYAGGGGGGRHGSYSPWTCTTSTGGGGVGQISNNNNPQAAGVANTGGGGGGGGSPCGTPGAAGGSGIVVIRYKFQ